MDQGDETDGERLPREEAQEGWPYKEESSVRSALYAASQLQLWSGPTFTVVDDAPAH